MRIGAILLAKCSASFMDTISGKKAWGRSLGFFAPYVRILEPAQ